MSTNSSRAKVLVLAGPTASGKTELLAKTFGAGAPVFFSTLASRRKAAGRLPLNAEVISADSFQAYRGMNIGTAKPAPEVLSIFPHHLVDFLDPDEQYTAGDFVRRADALCGELAARNCLPIVAGGTGFYLRNFICGPSSAPPSDAIIRSQVAADLAEMGAEALRRELSQADPASAARISANDHYRLTRAVEILRSTGMAPSDFAPSSLPRPCHELLVLGILRPRSELNERIDARVESMFADGLADEVSGLMAKGYGADSPGMRAIGYREFFTMEGADKDEIKAAIKLHTRQYAKRQMTFFRALPGIVWIKPSLSEFTSLVGDFLLD